MLQPSSASDQRRVRTATAILAAVLPGACAAILALLTARALEGQTPAPVVSTVTGTVIDSLHGGMLTGAQVQLAGTARVAYTDSAGNFRFDSVRAGPVQFGVFHPLLDSLGVSITSPTLHVQGGQPLVVTLATPSATTIATYACRNIAPPSVGVLPTPMTTGPGVVIGRVLDADTEQPVGNAVVELSWVELQASRSIGVQRTRHRREAVSSAGGDFHVCYVPLNVEATLVVARRSGGAAAAAGSVSRPVAPGGHVLTALTVHLPPLEAPTIAQLANAPATATEQAAASGTPAGASGTTASVASRRYATGAAVLTGRVVDRNLRPVASARAYVMGARDTAITSQSGSFSLHNLPAGTRTLIVRAIGFEPVTTPVELTSREPRSITVPFTATAVPVLKPVLITARLADGLKRVGFDLREKAGMGTFWTLSDIEKHKAYDFHDLFTTFPGVRVDHSPDGRSSLMATRGAGGCIGYAPSSQGVQATPGQNCGPCLTYVIDGHPYNETEEGDMDTYVRPEDIGAIEVYQENEVPRSIPGVTKADCLNIVVWTKARLGI